MTDFKGQKRVKFLNYSGEYDCQKDRKEKEKKRKDKNKDQEDSSHSFTKW